MTNLYYGTVKQILERVSSVMIDREAIKDLVKFVMEVILLNALLEMYLSNFNLNGNPSELYYMTIIILNRL